MKTITIQIGNTDDKLTQALWAQFFERCNDLIRTLAHRTHFAGCSVGSAPWQNACWVILIADDLAQVLQKRLTELREQFHQDSVAWTEGETVFI
jgi:hypothetical protein